MTGAGISGVQASQGIKANAKPEDSGLRRAEVKK
jgi:hypothetical protein